MESGSSWEGDTVIEKFDNITANNTFISKTAKYCPGQLRIPTPNRVNDCGDLHVPATPFANLSGLNSFASLPQSSMSRCIAGSQSH
ncbi:hypothetical protein QQ045_008829 [Rhodiola kirilowii]